MIYELYGIVEHRGSFYYGHYVCNIRSSPTSWHHFDDSQASPYYFSKTKVTGSFFFFCKRIHGFPSTSINAHDVLCLQKRKRKVQVTQE